MPLALGGAPAPAVADIPDDQVEEHEDLDKWSSAAGCRFSVLEVGRCLKRRLLEEAKEQNWLTAPVLKTKAVIYTTAVMEYVVAVVLELAGNNLLRELNSHGGAAASPVIRGSNIVQAICGDPELKVVWGAAASLATRKVSFKSSGESMPVRT